MMLFIAEPLKIFIPSTQCRYTYVKCFPYSVGQPSYTMHGFTEDQDKEKDKDSQDHC